MSQLSSSKWDLLKNDLIVVAQQLREKSFQWKVGSILLLVGLPVFLLIFQIVVLIGAIPPEYTVSQLVLNYSQPKVTAMFATNYIHNIWSFEHLTGNYGGYCLLLYISFILYFLVIPILKMHNVLHFEYPDSAFFGTAIVFLIGLPFAISGISILFGRMLSQTGGWGFSGIVWAFYGYLFFLILLIFYDNALFRIIHAGKESSRDSSESLKINMDMNLTNESTISSKVQTIIFLSFLIIIAPIYTICHENLGTIKSPVLFCRCDHLHQ